MKESKEKRESRKRMGVLRLIQFLSALTFFSAFSGPAHAQDEELTLYVRRNFGYSSGSQI